MESNLVTAILFFIGFVLLILGLRFYINHRKERRKFAARVTQMVGQLPTDGIANPSIPSSSRVKEYFLNTLKSLGDLVRSKDEGEISLLRKDFLKAGYRGGTAPLIFFGVKAFLAILLPLTFSLIKFLLMIIIPPMPFMLYGVLCALIGFYLPNLWLRAEITSRRDKILRGFPDALDLMVVCVEAGMGLDSIINRVGEEMRLSNKVVSEEFRLLNLELRAGKLRRDALKNLALRTDLEDVSSLVTLLIQTDRFGTSVAQALRVQSDSMRTRRHQRAQEAAAKLPVKLLFPLILFILPSLFVVILGSAVIRIYRVLFPSFGG